MSPTPRNPSLKEMWPLSESGRVLAAVVVALVATLMLLAWSPAEAYDSDAPKPESPYFQVASSEPGTDRLPLKSTQVDLRIADIVVTQHYRNEGRTSALL
jgi:Ca-activated chloride channel family protein